MSLKVGKDEIENFNKLKKENQELLEKDLYRMAREHFDKSDYIATIISKANTMKEVAELLGIEYSENGESLIKYTDSEDYVYVEKKFLSCNTLIKTRECMKLLRYFEFIHVEKVGLVFTIKHAIQSIDRARLYAVCKYSGNLELYADYFHEKYCKRITKVGGNTLPCMVGVKGLKKLEDSIPILTGLGKLISHVDTQFGVNVYDVHPNFAHIIKGLDISSLTNISLI